MLDPQDQFRCVGVGGPKRDEDATRRRGKTLGWWSGFVPNLGKGRRTVSADCLLVVGRYSARERSHGRLALQVSLEVKGIAAFFPLIYLGVE